MKNVTIKLKTMYMDNADELYFDKLSDDEPSKLANQICSDSEFIFIDNNTVCLRRDDIIGYIFD